MGMGGAKKRGTGKKTPQGRLGVGGGKRVARGGGGGAGVRVGGGRIQLLIWKSASWLAEQPFH